ncbi:MAG: hypothetical protein JST44_23620 [Cyanobacteria bacterium SZAS LIN-5]|nr:hypothetical protein [Cyanobacteria bacterium SZAS LIN-5]
MIVTAIYLFGGVAPGLAAPLGYTQPKYLERANRPIPEWAKDHPRLTTEQTPNVPHGCSKNLHTAKCIERCKKNVTTAQTPGVAHTCKKDVHSPSCLNNCAKNLATADTAGVTHVCSNDVHNLRCVKKCVVNTTETKPTGPAPAWHVRGGTAFPVRDRSAERALLNRLYNQNVRGTVIQPKNNK